MNIAIKTGTWLASVNEAGSSTIFGINIGMMIPVAHRRPAITMLSVLLDLVEVLISNLLE